MNRLRLCPPASARPPYDAPIELHITGPGISELRQLGQLGLEARRIMGDLPAVTVTRDDLSESLPKLGLVVDEEQAQQSGLSNQEIAQQLEAYLGRQCRWLRPRRH